ncbi:actinorhodin polyketide putative beta-ketoacyl synthase 2 [Longispora fulva]|uniref:Minimal PKS chain-length factor (CLF/KS beta) n=1 Tax=Longispora fulva TaxID=619741 RepID=A0A8J7GJC1_9ACTN|nr:beta-ketoacyl synthase N-terminal-like domain-containing protein [Longispora fulva]MBG6134369.1 minimal PKS chain-length factor (CLF/KS beta) [Longispora fulva]GIG63078.1 actinorhodin polyketide putative beta-ketoacyl synthase 2 [Longispora fulva]
MTRTVVTGIGVVSPSGIGAEEHWRSHLAGELQVRRIEGFDPSSYATTLAGQVRGFAAQDHLDGRLTIQTDRWTWMSLAAAQLALDDAKYDPAAHDPYATSVVLAAGYGGSEFGQREVQAMCGGGPAAVTAYQSIAWFYAASAGQTSILHGTKGPASVLVSDGAGGLDCLGGARRVVRRGTPAVLTGGTEAPVVPYALACLVTNGRMTTSADPLTGYRPFDVDADGYVPGEGGAVLMLENADTALARGVQQIYGEIAGYAATHDAHHHENPAADCRQLARAMRLAIADAGLTPDDIGFVVADGAGTPALDALEAQAIHEVFGERSSRVPVTAPQGFTGRMCAGSTINVATALLALRDGIVPAVGNLHRPGPYQLDLVRQPRELRTDAVLINARGYGGFNSSIVLRRFHEEGES